MLINEQRKQITKLDDQLFNSFLYFTGSDFIEEESSISDLKVLTWQLGLMHKLFKEKLEFINQKSKEKAA